MAELPHQSNVCPECGGSTAVLPHFCRPESDPMDRCNCLIPYIEGAGQHSPGCAVFDDEEVGQDA
jgi:hypothetical protein